MSRFVIELIREQVLEAPEDEVDFLLMHRSDLILMLNLITLAEEMRKCVEFGVKHKGVRKLIEKWEELYYSES
jgi:hypothetical protein